MQNRLPLQADVALFLFPGEYVYHLNDAQDLERLMDFIRSKIGQLFLKAIKASESVRSFGKVFYNRRLCIVHFCLKSGSFALLAF